MKMQISQTTYNRESENLESEKWLTMAGAFLDLPLLVLAPVIARACRQPFCVYHWHLSLANPGSVGVGYALHAVGKQRGYVFEQYFHE